MVHFNSKMEIKIFSKYKSYYVFNRSLVCITFIEADTNRLWDGWDSDRMHPVGDEIIHSRRRVATDWDTIAEEELQRYVNSSSKRSLFYVNI